eukprot:350653-Rhodomonas_salina.1
MRRRRTRCAGRTLGQVSALPKTGNERKTYKSIPAQTPSRARVGRAQSSNTHADRAASDPRRNQQQPRRPRACSRGACGLRCGPADDADDGGVGLGEEEVDALDGALLDRLN